ncbi:Kelch repeat-containing protein [Maribellus mangrovi]|uniref:Kelch repeat-containing protein n=1 Tax=Maribellus mangrovi TaxID=3133146 RepID=UPI0030EDAB59
MKSIITSFVSNKPRRIYLKNLSFLLFSIFITLTTSNVEAQLIDIPNLVVLEGASVFDSKEKAFKSNAEIVIKDSEILRIGSVGDFEYPDDATVYDVSGRFIIPGLVDFHVHMGAYSPNGITMAKYLAAGVTSIRIAGTIHPEAIVKLKNDVKERRLDGPRLFVAGHFIDEPGRTDNTVKVGNADQMRAEIQRQAAIGVDYIKLYWDVSPELLGVAVEEAHALGLKVLGHLRKTSWTEAANLGIDFLTHCGSDGPIWELVDNDSVRNILRSNDPPRPYYPDIKPEEYFHLWAENVNLEGDRMDSLIDALVQGNVTVDPTMAPMQSLFFGDDTEILAKLHPECTPAEITDRWGVGWQTKNPKITSNPFYTTGKEIWPLTQEITRKLYEGGVRLTTGSDFVMPWITPGDGLHRELELLVEAGIPADEVLLIATKNAAEALDVLSETGTIEEGKLADLVVLAANPLEDIRNSNTVQMVFKQGHYYQPDVLLDAIGVNCSKPDWQQLSSMDIARGYLSSCTIDSLIYIFGGETTPVYTNLDSADVFNTKTNQWMDLEAIPTAVVSPAVEEVNSKIYVLGGLTHTSGNGIGMNTVYEYDPDGNKWVQKNNSPYTIGAWSSKVMDSTIYLFGGSNNMPSDANKAWTYEPASETWTSLPNMLYNQAYGNSVELIDNKFYYIGGSLESGFYGPTGKSQVYDPNEGNYTELAVMPVPVVQHRTVVYNNKILVFGGSKSIYAGCNWSCSVGTNCIQEYDPATNTWTLMRPMPFTRSAMTVEKVDNYVYLIGGYPNGRDLDQPLDEVRRFNLNYLEEWCEGVNIQEPSKALKVGDEYTLNADILPSDFANKAMIWTSDNDSVLTVTDSINGIIKCVGDGTAMITAQLKYGSNSDAISLTVNKNLPPVLTLEEDTFDLIMDSIVKVSSNEDCFVYLVTEGTGNSLSEIIRNRVKSTMQAFADSSIEINISDLEVGTYWLYARDPYKNISEPVILIIEDTGTGINRQISENFRIYPNPTNGVLTIETSDLNNCHISITTMNGQVLLSKEVQGNRMEIDVSEFRKGIYLITIKSDKAVRTKKVIKL